jgi:PAS domain S-box-containing protein
MLGFWTAALLTVAVGTAALWQLYKISGPLNEQIPQVFDKICKSAQMDSIAQLIRYYDEALTQSVRNYAFTQDSQWRQRYEQLRPRLEAVLQKAISEGDTNEKQIFSEVKKASDSIVLMQQQTVELVDGGSVLEAVALLHNPDYLKKKEICQEGLKDYANRRGSGYDQVRKGSEKLFEWATSQTLSMVRTGMFSIAIAVVCVFVLTLFIGFIISYSVNNNDKRTQPSPQQSGTESEIQSALSSGERIKKPARNIQRTTPVKVESSTTESLMHKRIRELNCLYGLSKLIEQPDIPLDTIFHKAAALTQNAYQNPEKTCVRITFDGINYQTDNFDKSELSQFAEITTNHQKAGNIEVYYLGDRQAEPKEPFLKEEREMLDAVARRLGDAAERIQAVEKLQLFRNLLDGSNDCIFVVEPKWGRFLDVNDRACNSLGYIKEELIEMTVRDIDESMPNDATWTDFVRRVNQRGYLVVEGLHKRKDGTAFPVEVNVKLIKQQKQNFLIAVARDITERKKAQQKQAQLLREIESANKELKDFAHIVSHDLKAPLRGIKSLVDWITTDYSDKLDEDGKEQMALLVTRVERMRNLIDGVLQYSRVGRTKEEIVSVDLNVLVPAVIDMVSPPDNIEITVETHLPVILCEHTRIQQVFQNLISNAVKYMDKPRGLIKIGCSEEGDFFKFSVADNGPGIEKEHFERIFQIFQTLSARDEYESTGVGLSVVKKVVEMYGGKIWVESEVGQGSTFFFTFPKQKQAAQPKKVESPAHA